MSEAISVLSLTVVIATFIITWIYKTNLDKKFDKKSEEIDKQIEKRVKEEIAPYQEALEAIKTAIKRSPHEITTSLPLFGKPPDDLGPITVVKP